MGNFNFNFNYSLLFLINTVLSCYLELNRRRFRRDTEVLKQLKNSLEPDSVSPGRLVRQLLDLDLDGSTPTTPSSATASLSASDSTLSSLARPMSPHSVSTRPVTLARSLPPLETCLNSRPSFSNLTWLALSRNSFTGEIPAVIESSLSNLKDL